eukprot:CAMPEP_0181314662 /NCGR_PEP_ID=MMETSP1101-20121128/14941_1 /TAXON_ID=46948 /ORGANISM="Rhodomonas abbreviata, Strain Caron Lab Isolate" /LENGTH=162 /DNA_ID=CAMNT_0023421777 /DNA_START=179 /DNA_END=664 /DNA_ORIENTATION=+
MRTGKMLAKRAGPSLFSKPMLALYMVIFVLIYVSATLYTASATQRRQVERLEKELNTLRSKPIPPPPAAPQATPAGAAAGGGGESVDVLKQKIKDQAAQLERIQAAQLAVQAQSAAVQAQNMQAQHPAPQAAQPAPHKEPEPVLPPIQPAPVHNPAPAAAAP